MQWQYTFLPWRLIAHRRQSVLKCHRDILSFHQHTIWLLAYTWWCNLGKHWRSGAEKYYVHSGSIQVWLQFKSERRRCIRGVDSCDRSMCRRTRQAQRGLKCLFRLQSVMCHCKKLNFKDARMLRPLTCSSLVGYSTSYIPTWQLNK